MHVKVDAFNCAKLKSIVVLLKSTARDMKMAFNGCDIDGIPHNKRMCMGANVNDSNNNSNGTGHDDIEMKAGIGLIRVKNLFSFEDYTRERFL